MIPRSYSRRAYFKLMAGGTAAAACGSLLSPTGAASSFAPKALPDAGAADRARRMKWWHEARFGMFIHWGLYSVLGRHEWAMEMEGIPVGEY